MFYRCHVFCCTNQRPDNHPRGSCADRNGVALRNYMKTKAKDMSLDDVRINSAGCLDRCELGPTMVIYPEGTWYRAETPADVDKILTQHLRDGQPVERLMLSDDE